MDKIKKFLTAAVVFFGLLTNTGCAIHHAKIKSSFVKVNVSTSIVVCGSRIAAGESECVEVADINSSGSGAIVSNNRVFGGTPRTLVLTANHVCDAELPQRVLNTVRQREGFVENVRVVKEVEIVLLDSSGQRYEVSREPWVRNVPADICIVEASINAPSLNIARSAPNFGDMIVNIAAPGGFMMPSASGGAVFIIDGRYSGSYMVAGEGTHAIYTLWAIGGSSGSPIMNRAGEMIGMVSAINTSFWPRAVGETVLTREPVMIRFYSGASPLTISPTLEQIRDTINSAISAMNRGEPFVYPRYSVLNTLSNPINSEENGDTGELVYPIYISEE